tara:strand:+ start:2444 stop:2878 length:435 start_codon:yes stop_codon:yes gene_type:complete
MKVSTIILFVMFLLIANTGFVFAGFDDPGSGASVTEDPGSGPSQGYDGQPFANEVVLLNPLKGEINSIPAFFRAIIQILLVFAIPFVVFFIIWAGFLYVTARGNPEKISQAHKALLYAIIGGLLILGAELLLTVITNTIADIRN